MKYNGITLAGRRYLATKLATKTPIKFSSIKVGDGILNAQDMPADFEKLKHVKFSLKIAELSHHNETTTLMTYLDNIGLKTGYYPREIGVFVEEGGKEILYYYMNDGTETSYIPEETLGPFKIELKINLITSNASEIIVNSSSKDLYVDKDYIDRQLEFYSKKAEIDKIKTYINEKLDNFNLSLLNIRRYLDHDIKEQSIGIGFLGAMYLGDTKAKAEIVSIIGKDNIGNFYIG